MFQCNSNANSDPPMHQTSPSNQFPNITDHHHNPTYSYLSFHSQLLDDDDLFLGTVLPYASPPPPPPPPPPPQPPLLATEDCIGGAPPPEQRAKEKGKRKRAIAGSSKVSASHGGGSAGANGKQKRRRGKTDRHSKIHTAKGPRDRRMRLSLQIARKFFDLQDMLGFDKASKTIEWLFNKSKAAIKDLTERSCTGMASSPSDQGINILGGDLNDGSSNGNKNKGEKGALVSEKMRENREKARARARERTKEKLSMMHKQGRQRNPSCGSSSTSTMRADQILMEQSQYGFDDNEQHRQLPLEDQMASVGIIEKYLTTSSSTLFDFHHHENNHDDQHLSRIPSSSCDPMMVSSGINFAGYTANWVTQNMSMSSNHTEMLNPNSAFMGRSYNQGS